MERTRALDQEEVERFVASLADYHPVIPDELVRYYLAKSGFQCDDVRIERLVALAAQKFLADVAGEAVAHARSRQFGTIGRGRQNVDTRLVLSTDDLERALREYGVKLQKPPYYADSASAGEQETKPSGAAGGTAAPSGAPKGGQS
mmetsp:Transcript_581/g.1960  ORF Transcript_581/g.1960 Transcript_581/m.1960 type:complete len:146 (-) Transcript_581:110-547(-)|eukprot:CAMPEP_0198728218 /NCGR_PEP_ID=MMETSP1475-20131203/8004_1 /TAXON_ID= ORGANISM="Unidentified sp., Strain CCMP1999" /NCGR_SAMPLE_ID=MMETSP1475 /ASSEMBLY_ACC=CAM_ASM_001111 /LENGTH=145 /DNA_ID=CAMNT_0044490523 /DNA_START=97 /DNA_END=534 /DNA_ORIENTATION=+